MNDPGLLKAIFASKSDYAIIVTDEFGNVIKWNTGAEHITGFLQHEIIGQNASIIFTEEDRIQRIPQKAFGIALGGRCAVHRWYMRKDGSRFWAESVTTPVYDDNNKLIGFLKILRDITEKMRADEEILSCARFDNLTGLSNRSTFKARLHELVALTLRSDQLLILQMVDLDHFKDVNDSLGHHAGDVLLQQAAQRNTRYRLHRTDRRRRICDPSAECTLPGSRRHHGSQTTGRIIEAFSH